METVYIQLNQVLSDIWDKIPSNKIIFKNITGIGATTLEILTERHSIIIEPNVPVIIGKSLKHPDVLAVYKGVNEKHILDYLKNENIPFKKIITTPESFEKIFMTTLLESDFSMKYIYENFFLLFDECDKITRDIGFRADITIPMNRFFDFSEKSFISATALVPSDPRFAEHNFEKITIVPTYPIADNVNIITSNNVYSIFEDLNEITNERKNFIFFNSLKGIEKLISLLNIKDSSAIFCSDKVLGNVDGKVKFSASMIAEDRFLKYNFFTSRFFTAVDFDIDYDCNVFLITDTEVANYTTIDPNSDAIQIIGRFRNKNIDKRIFILSDVNKKFKDKEILDKEVEIKTFEWAYDLFLNYRSATINPSALFNGLTRILNTMPFNDYLDDKGKKCYFKIDNQIFEDHVLSKYQNVETLIGFYRNCKIENTEIAYFNVSHRHQDKFFDAKTIVHKKIFLSYRDNLKRILKASTDLLELDELDEHYDILLFYLKEARLYYAEIFEAIDFNLLEELGTCYDRNDVLKLVKLKRLETDQECIPFIAELRIHFPVDSIIEVGDFKNKLKELIDKYNLSLPATARQAQYFLKLSDRFRGRGEERTKYFYRIEGHL